MRAKSPVKVRAAGPSHPIYKAVMFGLMLISLAWLVVNYIAGMAGLGNWNVAIGFALMSSGLLMTMCWR